MGNPVRVSALVGALIGGGWWLWSLYLQSPVGRFVFGLIGAVVLVWLVLLTLAPSISDLALSGQDTYVAPKRRLRLLFGVNLLVEVALINVVLALLSSASLQIYRTPAISLIVGLHFIPMAVIWRRRALAACGGRSLSSLVVFGLRSSCGRALGAPFHPSRHW